MAIGALMAWQELFERAGLSTGQRAAARKEVVHAFSDPALVREVFAPPEPFSLKTGIGRMAAWVRERGPTAPVKFANIEIRKNLPAGWEG
jgi:hypothetical protein